MVNSTWTKSHLILYLALWAYQNSIKISTGFSPFQLIHGVEAVFPIECEVPSLKIAIDFLPYMTQLEEHLVYLEHLNEQPRDATLENEAHKTWVKSQYDKFVHPGVFYEGDLVLVYDQDKDDLGAGKFNPMWFVPYVMRRVLEKGSYEIEEFEGNVLSEPRNGLYLKKYYS